MYVLRQYLKICIKDGESKFELRRLNEEKFRQYMRGFYANGYDVRLEYDPEYYTYYGIVTNMEVE